MSFTGNLSAGRSTRSRFRRTWFTIPPFDPVGGSLSLTAPFCSPISKSKWYPLIWQNKYKTKLISIGHTEQISIKHHSSNIWKHKCLSFRHAFNFPRSVSPVLFQKTETVVLESGWFYFCVIIKMPFNLSNDTLQISLADEWNQVSCHSCQLQGWDHQINL